MWIDQVKEEESKKEKGKIATTVWQCEMQADTQAPAWQQLKINSHMET